MMRPASLRALMAMLYLRIGTKTCQAFSLQSELPSVRVFDNVFSAEACLSLHELAVEHAERATNLSCEGSSVFYRTGNRDKLLWTPLERAIDSALRQMGDTSSECVEYWSREEYMNIDTHSDVDEEHLIDDEYFDDDDPDSDGMNRIRCPKQGHILYLDVDENLRGPTYIFPTKLKGWGCNHNDNQQVEMVVVPAVRGRVARFDGRAMHGVPKPADRWLLSDAEEFLLREQEDEEFRKCDDEEEEEDDSGDAIGSIMDRRGVLLFNTWKHPPAYVDQDPALHMPSGVSLGDDEISNSVVSLWEKAYGPLAEKVQCNNRQQWREVPIETIPPKGDLDQHQVRVNLMGNKQRRCYPNSTAKLWASCAKDIRKAALEPQDPTLFSLSERKFIKEGFIRDFR